jgi:hypothetical protein
MEIIVALLSVAVLILVLVDGFEAMVLPRRVTRPYRPTRLYYRLTWAGWRALARRLAAGKRRETFLSLFGPLSLLGLFGMWVVGLIAGFAGLQWALDSALGAGGHGNFLTYLYLSGGAFFTVGYGDVTPGTTPGRALAIVEAALGFTFLAVVISYLPVLYQASSRREVTISLLDARAGSPPSAAQLLARATRAGSCAAVDPFLAEWERWAAELLESHLSYPVLSFYRSQHDNQSWLAALTAVLDTCALLMVAVKGPRSFQAQLTFAMARHAAVDLALVFKKPPVPPQPDRLPADRQAALWQLLQEAGLPLRDAEAVQARLTELRGTYEPFVNALAQLFLFALPPLLPEKPPVDNWQTSAWMRRIPGIGKLPGDDHFD